MRETFILIKSAVLHWFNRLLNAIFVSSTDSFAKIVTVSWLIGLYGFGIWLWGYFYSYGNISLDFLDWAEVTGPRYALLRSAVESGQFPLHAGDTTALRGITDRYFAIADVTFSPQYLLLPWFGTATYLFYDTLLLYSVGFWGLLLFARRYRLGPFACTLFFLLFNFNGFMTTHLAVGHANWTAFFLLPFFVLLTLELVETQRFSWGWVLKLSLLELLILSQGGFHLFVWSLLFLLCLALLNIRLLLPVFLGGLFSGLVCLPRLLPPALVVKDITNQYLGGFPSLTDLIASLVVLRHPIQAIQVYTDTLPLNGWEVDFYIGQLGLWLLLIFGVFLPLRKDRALSNPTVQVLLASLALTILSIGGIFNWVTARFHIPLLTAERVTSRILIVPLVMALALAVIQMQKWLQSRSFSGWGQVVLLALGGLMYHDLYQHLVVWRIRYLDQLTSLFPKVPFNPANHTLANHSDGVYVALLAAGAAVAAVAIAFLLWRSLKSPTFLGGLGYSEAMKSPRCTPK